jgi:hypothetical protein
MFRNDEHVYVMGDPKAAYEDNPGGVERGRHQAGGRILGGDRGLRAPP